MQALDVAARTGHFGPASAVSAGQVHVEERDVRGERTTGGDGALDVGGVTDDLEVGP